MVARKQNPVIWLPYILFMYAVELQTEQAYDIVTLSDVCNKQNVSFEYDNRKEREKEMRKYTKKYVLLTCIMAAVCICLMGCNANDYKRANDYYSNGDYELALDIYTSLGDYKESVQKAMLCKYEIGNTYFEKAQYSEALSIYEEISGCEEIQSELLQKKYEIASSFYENANYKEASTIYTHLGDYGDSKNMLASCEKEIGMIENADYDFLKIIEESVLWRMGNNDEREYKTLVDTELAYLQKFEEMDFFDPELKEIAIQYIEGLHIQKNALSLEVIAEHQIEWQKGAVLRFEALKKLYDNYDFLSDNEEFIGTYIAKCDEVNRVLDGYNAIENDLSSQLLAEDFQWEWDGYNLFCTITNNTDYTYATVFEFKFQDADGVVYETSNTYIEDIKPGMSYRVEVFVSDPNKLDYFEWSNYYDYVK